MIDIFGVSKMEEGVRFILTTKKFYLCIRIFAHYPFLPMKPRLTIATVICLMMIPLSSPGQECGIIPTPKKVVILDGQFLLDRNTEIILDDTCADNVFSVNELRKAIQEMHPDIMLPLHFAGDRKSKGTSSVIECLIVNRLPIDTFPEQGYTIETNRRHMVVKAVTTTGMFYALQSLKQLCRNFYKEEATAIELPCLSIIDYPSMQYRGWLDDISRGPIPTVSFYKSVIATCAGFKLNFFNFYTEHVFKLNDYPDIAPSDGLTAEEIHELEVFAAPYHIEIFGNQQVLAHADKTLRIPFYRDMADTKSNYHPGKKETETFLKNQLATVSRSYSSKFFNINCDETEGLGTGKAKAYVDSVGVSQAYVQHIAKIHDMLSKMGKRVLIWGDIACKDTGILQCLPADIVPVVWSYAPAAHYDELMLPFRERGFDFMVAPGLSMWSHIFPMADVYTVNIANMVRDGWRNGAIGVMNTAWDDSGESLFNSTWHGMAWGAEMSWTPIRNTETEKADTERNNRLRIFDRAFERQFLHAPQEPVHMLKMIEDCGIQDFGTFGTLSENILDFYPSRVSAESIRLNRDISVRLDTLQNAFRLPKGTVPDVTNAMYRIAAYVCRREKFVAMRNVLRGLLYRYMTGNLSDSVCGVTTREELKSALMEHHIPAALAELHSVKKMHLKLWDEENRPYSRNIVEARYDEIARELLDIPYKVIIEPVMQENGTASVTLHTLLSDEIPIQYSVDGRDPQKGENPYEKPITLYHSSLVKAMTLNDMGEPVVTAQYVLIHRAIGNIARLNSKYADYRPQYAAGGVQALADGRTGGDHYADGHWQGYWGNDLDVEYDFGRITDIDFLQTHFFQNGYDWIFAPRTVELYVSTDGVRYHLAKILPVPGVTMSATDNGIWPVQAGDLGLQTRYLRVVAKNAGPLPAWHQAAGQPSYIFCDEIIIR